MNQKIGMEAPNNYDDFFHIYEANSNTLWQDSVRLDMKKLQVASHEPDYDEVVPLKFQYIKCHIFVDINMEYFITKGLLSGGEIKRLQKLSKMQVCY